MASGASNDNRADDRAALRIPPGTRENIATAIGRYWNAWPQQRDRVLARQDERTARLRALGIPDDVDLDTIAPAAREAIDGDEDALFALQLRTFERTLGGPLGLELLGGGQPFGIAALVDGGWPAILADNSATETPPVMVVLAQTDPSGAGQHLWLAVVAGEAEGMDIRALAPRLPSAAELLRKLDAMPQPLESECDVLMSQDRPLFRRFARDFWAQYAEISHAPGASVALRLPRSLPQPTFPEAKRIARGLALGPDGIGWSEIIGEFALMHLETGAEHNLRLEGGLIPEWWGKPSDSASLRAELSETGHDGVAVFYNAVGLVLHSDAGHVDVEIDDLIARVGIDPRSRAERSAARLQVWRILTILGAVRVVGARRRIVRDRVSGRSVQLESTDPLLSVSAWRRVGTQESFDAGASVPLAVTLQATPWLARWRGNRAVLQDFGNLLAISEIPIGKPSGAWARAIGWALQQLWREQATRATYARTGDEHRPTARFQPFTRRQLLDLFPPRPSVQDVLGGPNPVRAITYWDAAIEELRARGVVNYYGGSRDWSDRPRKGWADLWLDEPLDLRPSGAGVNALASIATSAKRKRRRQA